MMKYILRHPSDLIVVIFAILTLGTRDIENPYSRAIDSDGKGYYAYLPAIFIYDDFTFSFTEEAEMKHYPEDGSRRFGFINDVGEGKKANQYYPGVILLWLLFFLIAHFLSYISDFDPDGYSIMYQYAIVLASWFYLWIGCRMLHKLVSRYVPQSPSAFITFAVALATGLFCYTAYAPAFTHTYSFALIGAFLYLCIKIFERYDTKQVLLAVLIFGLIAITRPTNIVVILLVPFAAGSIEAIKIFFRKFFSDKKAIAGMLVLAVLVVSLPVWLWYEQTGKLIVYSYGQHTFDFSNPQFFNNLLSYRKGLFVYTPLAFIALFGLVQLFRLNKFRFITLTIFLLAATYIISSWECWWYGSGFGQRAYIDYYVVLGLLLAFLYQLISKSKWLKGAFFTAIPALMVINILQTYQHIAGYLPDDHITKNIYWSRFLKMKHSPPFEEDKVKNVLSLQNDFNEWADWIQDIPSKEFNGRTVSFVDSSAHANAMYERDLTEFMTDSGTVVRLRSKLFAPGDIKDVVLILSLDTGGMAYHFNKWSLEEHIDENEWQEIEFYSVLPKAQAKKNTFKVYFLNGVADDVLYIDELKIDIFQPL